MLDHSLETYPCDVRFIFASLLPSHIIEHDGRLRVSILSANGIVGGEP